MKIYEIRYRNGCHGTLPIITSHILFGLGASLSLVNTQGDWLTIDESEATRPNDVIIERVYLFFASSVSTFQN